MADGVEVDADAGFEGLFEFVEFGVGGGGGRGKDAVEDEEDCVEDCYGGLDEGCGYDLVGFCSS